MKLQLCTWQEVDDYLTRSTGIIIPIGSTEQHGPSGLIGTDAICPEVIANGLSEQMDVLVAPTLSIGMAQHHLGFAGSIAFRPSTLMAVVKDVVLSLRRHGFTHCYFLNGHGGNIATVTAAFSEVYAESSFSDDGGNKPSVRCKLANWYMGPSVRKLSKELYGGAEGSHATPSEVSLSYYAYPDAVKDVNATRGIAPSGGFYDANDYRSRFEDGRIGSDPSLASVEHGERLYKAAINDVAQDYRTFLSLP
ncbi:MAG: creatininase family protein [Gammaproteobacteria bacterium]|nr:creatininase family protein [Gammaproteobacteria bacterium]